MPNNISGIMRSVLTTGRVRHGFTLVETIVALTVISVALSIFVSMFLSATMIAGRARDNTIAAELAAAYLNTLTAAPEIFSWDTHAADANGLFEILEKANAPSGLWTVPPPETTLAGRDSHQRNVNLYEKFTPRAWGRLPSPDADAYEVTISIHWESRGLPRMFTLTSSIPKFLIRPAGEDVHTDVWQEVTS